MSCAAQRRVLWQHGGSSARRRHSRALSIAQARRRAVSTCLAFNSEEARARKPSCDQGIWLWRLLRRGRQFLIYSCSRLLAAVLLLVAALLMPSSAHATRTPPSPQPVTVQVPQTDQQHGIGTTVAGGDVASLSAAQRGPVDGGVSTAEPADLQQAPNTSRLNKGFFKASEINNPANTLTKREELTYYFHKAITSGTPKKCAVLLCLCFPVVLILGPMYGKASERKVGRGMYLTFCTLMRVPSPVYKEKRPVAAVILNTVFLCGLFVFAVFLGLITEDVKAQVALIKEGITPVACKQHTVICYWNESTPALLRQISKARRGKKAFQGPVVVVADRNKFSMDQEVQMEVFEKTNSRFDVETRRGSPLNILDLQRAGVGRASTVFVMLPDSGTVVSPRGVVVPEVATLTQRNALKTATALRVSSLRTAKEDQPLVLQDSNGGVKEIGYADRFLTGYKAADKVAKQQLGPAIQPLGEHVMTSLAAQCACRPGLARVVDYLFTHDPKREQLRYMAVPDEGPQTYGCLRRRLCGAACLGYWSATEQRTLLNPKDSDQLVPGDELLMLSQSGPSISPEAVVTDDVVQDAKQWMSSKHNVHPKDKPKRVIVLNWMQDVNTLIQHFADFSPSGSEVVFVHQEKRKMPRRIGSVRFRQVVSSKALDREAMLKAGFENSNAVVYGPNMEVSDSVYDSQLISDVMVLQSWYNEQGCSSRLHILAPARDPFTASVVHHTLRDFGDAQVRLQKVDPETRVSEICSLQQRSIGDSTAPDEFTETPTDSTVYINAPAEPALSVQQSPEQRKPKQQTLSQASSDQLPLAHVISAELYMPREFATAMMVHCSMEPRLMYILQELFDSQSGHSIWLRPAQYLHINSADNPDPVSFGWVAEAARVRGETALGIITREGEVNLSPPVNHMYKFRPGDRIVVIQHEPPTNLKNVTQA